VKKIRLHLNENHNATFLNILNKHNYEYEYPLNQIQKLKQAISNLFNISAENVFVVSGIDEGIFHFLQFIKLSGKTLLLNFPNYIGIIDAVEALNISYITCIQSGVSFESKLIIDELEKNKKIGAVYLCNPRNPVGTAEELESIIEYCRKNEILVFLDEAYAEFCNNGFPNGSEVMTYSNVIISRTFSKAYGLAGIRCGYIYTINKDFSEYLSSVEISNPYRISTHTIECAFKAIQDRSRLVNSLMKIEKTKKYLSKEFDKLGIKYVPSKTNFICFTMGSRSTELCNFLRTEGIFITSTEKNGLTDYCRVSIGTKKETMFFIRKLRKFTKGV